VHQYRGADGEVYYLGLIDILEAWHSRWALQGRLLKTFFRYIACMQWFNPEGITAIPPADYALRFEEFMESQVAPAESRTRSLVLARPSLLLVTRFDTSHRAAGLPLPRKAAARAQLAKGQVVAAVVVTRGARQRATLPPR
jgi:hypothetical protein